MLSNRLYVGAVLVAWLAAMAWLVTDRILPPFLGGDAPISRPTNQIEPVAWQIEMGGHPCGVAVLQAVKGAGGAKEVHSFMRLDRIEAPKNAPLWLSPVLKSLRNLSFSMRTTTVYDALDALSSFHTKISLNQADVPISVRGRILGDQLRLTARVGDMTKRFEHAWPGEGVMGSDLTPSGRLLPLYEGRRWTEEVYSPLASPNEPMELVEVEVAERLPRFSQGGFSYDAWRVEYRSTEKTGSTEEGRLRAVLYVSTEGRILKQQAHFLGSNIVFYREPDEEAEKLASLLELDKYATLDATATEDNATGADADGVEPSDDATH